MDMRFILICIMFVLPLNGIATHIVGGNLEITHQNDGVYLLAANVFVDCLNGDPNALFEDEINVGLYEKESNTLIDKLALKLVSGKDDTLKLEQKKCSQKVNFCLQLVRYELITEFDTEKLNHKQGYYLSWERCCRNGIVNNIQQPASNGMVFYLEVNSFKIPNSSPRMNNILLNLLCLGSAYSFDFDFVDADGDSMYYELETPLAGFTSTSFPNSPIGDSRYPQFNKGPYKLVEWLDGYSHLNPIDAQNPLQMDANTGMISLKPKRFGVFVWAFSCTEYRDGEVLTKQQYELQTTVSKCDENSSPIVKSTSDTVYNVLAGERLYINYVLSDTDDDSVSVKLSSDIFNETIIDSPSAYYTVNKTIGKTNVAIYWMPNCKHISDGVYPVIISYSDNGCPIPKTGFDTIYIQVNSPDLPLKPEDFCVQKLDNNTAKLTWKPYKDLAHNIGGYLIEQSKGDNNNWVIIKDLKGQHKSYVDTSAIDNDVIRYCYRVSSYNICEIKSPTTYEFCLDTMLDIKPDTVPILNVSVISDHKIELTYQITNDIDFKHYEIWKTNDSIFFKVDSISIQEQNNWIDSNVNTQEFSYQYKIRLKNQCQNVGVYSNIGNSILLEGIAEPYLNKLNWNVYSTWEGAEYQVIASSRSDDFLFNTSDEFYDHDIDSSRGVWTYRIRSINENDSLQAYSNKISLVQSAVIWIPNAYSPNADGLNDIWSVYIDFVKSFDMQIYNRWGQLVFETTDVTKKWQAHHNEEDGLYYYLIVYKDLMGKAHYLKGPIYLLR